MLSIILSCKSISIHKIYETLFFLEKFSPNQFLKTACQRFELCAFVQCVDPDFSVIFLRRADLNMYLLFLLEKYICIEFFNQCISNNRNLIKPICFIVNYWIRSHESYTRFIIPTKNFLIRPSASLKAIF